MLTDLDEKSVDVVAIAEKALRDEQLLSELLNGVLSTRETIRYNCFKVLWRISEQHPEELYSEWDFFADLIDSGNTYFKYIAIYIIASLTRADAENRFEEMFDRYYGLLDDKSVVPASHVAGSSGKIARAKPKLQAKITDKLLSIDKTHHQQERRDLIKGYAIEAFNEYLEEIEDKQRIIEFVTRQLNSRSPRTAKRAREFLKKWGS